MPVLVGPSAIEPAAPADSPAAPRPVDEPVKPALAKPVPPKSPPPNPADVNRAMASLKRGEQLYRTGRYDEAERALKEALAVYPFLAPANLLLGKIFLIRGSATRDLALMQSARLMIEMSRALDPSLREAEVLLELFQVSPPE